MVYRGKPSAGCGNCRKRKIRCDQARPACGQCIKSHKICLGYRDPQEGMFLDQSREVYAKEQGRGGPSSSKDSGPHRKPSSSNSKSSTPVPTGRSKNSGAVVRFNTPSYSLQSSPEELGRGFFIHNYASVESSPLSGWFDKPLTADSDASDRAIHSVMTALGMVSLSVIRNETSMMKKARNEYGNALRHHSTALRIPEVASKNETLLSTLMLAIFENIAFTDRGSVKAWKSHIQGAIALLDVQQVEKLQTLSGKRLASFLRTHIIASCTHGSVDVPKSLDRLSVPGISGDAPGDHRRMWLEEIARKFVHLRAELKTKGPADHEKVINDLMEIDNEMDQWERSINRNQVYFTRRAEKSDDAYEDYIYIYRNFWIVRGQNHYRAMRCTINDDIIRRLCDPLDQLRQIDPDSAQRVIGMRSQLMLRRGLILQLARDICASVPFQLQGNIAIHGLAAIWPLLASIRAIGVPKSLQRWGIKQLDRIGHTMGIRQALFLAARIKSKANLDEPSPFPDKTAKSYDTLTALQEALLDNSKSYSDIWPFLTRKSSSTPEFAASVSVDPVQELEVLEDTRRHLRDRQQQIRAQEVKDTLSQDLSAEQGYHIFGHENMRKIVESSHSPSPPREMESPAPEIRDRDSNEGFGMQDFFFTEERHTRQETGLPGLPGPTTSFPTPTFFDSPQTSDAPLDEASAASTESFPSPDFSQSMLPPFTSASAS